MKCDFCKEDFEEKEIDEHHLHPRFMDNKKGEGKKVYLCRKCHSILHLTIPAILWNFIVDKEKAIEAVKKFTERRI